jgi:hypothetical protein
MKILLSPISMFASYTLAVDGAAIILDSVRYSLRDLVANMPQYDEQGELVAPSSLPRFVVSATEDSVTLLLPYWGAPSQAVAFPEPIIDPPDGPVQLPE